MRPSNIILIVFPGKKKLSKYGIGITAIGTDILFFFLGKFMRVTSVILIRKM